MSERKEERKRRVPSFRCDPSPSPEAGAWAFGIPRPSFLSTQPPRAAQAPSHPPQCPVARSHFCPWAATSLPCHLLVQEHRTLRGQGQATPGAGGAGPPWSQSSKQACRPPTPTPRCSRHLCTSWARLWARLV